MIVFKHYVFYNNSFCIFITSIINTIRSLFFHLTIVILTVFIVFNVCFIILTFWSFLFNSFTVINIPRIFTIFLLFIRLLRDKQFCRFLFLHLCYFLVANTVAQKIIWHLKPLFIIWTYILILDHLFILILLIEFSFIRLCIKIFFFYLFLLVCNIFILVSYSFHLPEMSTSPNSSFNSS